ncbi:MAG TPA: GNAT family N-acetyltransferase [Acidimicrobiales bacterium]|jgi:GNAT superfamily N-acetyltransferase|nr:GNAT family N-acetyltransferase [Acidimicrobiales bacterium]
MEFQLFIRPAKPDDVATILELVIELAEFENAREEVELEEATLFNALFGDAPQIFCDVAELEGEVVGAAIWFVNYSTWTGTHGIYLEDVYVRPSSRRAGIGGALLTTLARRAVERGYRRVEWSVLDWNGGAIGLYESVGAVPMKDWVRYRLSGDALEALGGMRDGLD